MRAGSRRLLARLLLLLTFAWTVSWAVVEGNRRVRLFADQRFSRARPSAWRLGSAPVAEFRRFLAEVEPHLLPGAVVAFSSQPQRRGDDSFFRMLWAAYYLPAQNLRLATRRPAPGECDYWLTFGFQPEGPGLALVYASAAGALARIER